MRIIARIFGIMFGFMMIIWGIMTTFLTDLTFKTYLWMLSLNFIIASIGSIFTYGEKKDLGLVDKWTLVGSVISFSLGVILVNMNFLEIVDASFLLFALGAWLLTLSITRIGKSIFIFKVNRALNKKTKTSKLWWLILVLGLLFAVFSILCFVGSALNVIPDGIIMGFSILFVGIDLLNSQFEE